MVFLMSSSDYIDAIFKHFSYREGKSSSDTLKGTAVLLFLLSGRALPPRGGRPPRPPRPPF